MVIVNLFFMQNLLNYLEIKQRNQISPAVSAEVLRFKLCYTEIVFSIFVIVGCLEQWSMPIPEEIDLW